MRSSASSLLADKISAVDRHVRGIRMKAMVVLVCALTSHTLVAQEVIPLWAEQPPFSKPNSLQETVVESWGVPCARNVTNPTLTVYRAQGATAVVP